MGSVGQPQVCTLTIPTGLPSAGQNRRGKPRPVELLTLSWVAGHFVPLHLQVSAPLFPLQALALAVSGQP